MALTKSSALFYWDAAGGPNPIVGGDPVFSRPSSGAAGDRLTAARKFIANVPRFDWVTLDGIRRPVMTLEPARTNIITSSEDFTSVWTNEGTPTLATGQGDPFGGTNAVLLGDDDGAADEGKIFSVAFTGNGVKSSAIFVKKGTSPAAGGSRLMMWSATSGMKVDATLTWVGNTPSCAMAAGTLLLAEPWRDDWWRLWFSSASVTASETHRNWWIRPCNVTAQTGNLYVFHPQVEDATFPTSDIGPATGSAVSRSQDVFYWKNPPAPQSMAIYGRIVAAQPMDGTSSALRFVDLGDPADTDARFIAYYSGGNLNGFLSNPSLQTSNPVIAMTFVPGDTLEFVLIADAATSKCRIIGSKNGGAASSALGAALGAGMPTVWSAQRMYLNSIGSTQVGSNKFANVKAVKLADLTNQPGVAPDASVIAELQNFRLTQSGDLI